MLRMGLGTEEDKIYRRFAAPIDVSSQSSAALIIVVVFNSVPAILFHLIDWPVQS